MKKLLAVVVFCLPAFGQTAYSGRGLNPGSAVYGATVSTGSPLTYSARTDNCVHGYSTNAITVAPFYNPATETCINGATAGQTGSGLVFQAGASDPLPFLRLDDPTTPTVVNTSFTSPDFGSYSVFATDQTTDGIKTGWSIPGASWANGTANDVILSPNGKTVQYFLHVIESRFLAHTCSPGNPCIVLSNIRTGLTCTPSATNYTSPNCTHRYQTILSG